MEKNTVVLSLEEYNSLRDFKTNFEDGKVIIYNEYGHVFYLSKNEFTKNILDYNNSLNNKCDSLNNEITILKRDKSYFKIEREKHEKSLWLSKENFSLEIDKIKKMNIFQFLKWRRK